LMSSCRCTESRQLGVVGRYAPRAIQRKMPAFAHVSRAIHNEFD
jgi:hypothetical protein